MQLRFNSLYTAIFQKMVPIIVRVLAVSVFAAAFQFHIATSASLEKRDWFIGQLPVAPEREYRCEPFYQPYCRCFNPNDRTHARFPNQRGQYAVGAQKEFRDFNIENTTKSQCSNKIGGFLCFFYFPFCSPNTALQKEYLPCREDCEEVRRDCEDVFVSHGAGWPDHLNCSSDYFKPKASTECVPLGEDPSYDACIQGNTTPTPSTDTTRATTITLPTIATKVPNTITPPSATVRPVGTRGPPEPVCNPDECVRCTTRFRTNCNSRTFRRNDYTWAAHVEVVNPIVVDGYKAYVVQKIKQYLPDPEEGPTMEEFAVVRTTSAECCSECLEENIKVGSAYLMSGHFTTDPLTWELNVKNCLVAEWTSKYTRNLDNWIAARR